MKFLSAIASVIAVAAAEKHKIDCKDWVKFDNIENTGGAWTVSHDEHQITHPSQDYDNDNSGNGNSYSEYIKKGQDNFCIRFDAMNVTDAKGHGYGFQFGFYSKSYNMHFDVKPNYHYDTIVGKSFWTPKWKFDG